jgi:hypothetical protein
MSWLDFFLGMLIGPILCRLIGNLVKRELRGNWL